MRIRRPSVYAAGSAVLCAVLSVPLAVFAQEAAPAPHGSVVVYRAEEGWVRGDAFVICDSTDVARLPKHRYLTLHLAPGTHTIETALRARGDRIIRTTQISVQPGETYFVRVIATGETISAGGMTWGPGLGVPAPPLGASPAQVSEYNTMKGLRGIQPSLQLPQYLLYFKILPVARDDGFNQIKQTASMPIDSTDAADARIVSVARLEGVMTLADYDEAIRLKPDDASAYLRRAAVHGARGDVNSAIKDYDRAIRLKPDDASAYLSRAAAHRSKGDVKNALKDYDRAIRLQPDAEMPYFNRAILRGEKGDYEAALSDYAEVLRLKPDSYRAYFYRADLRETRGDNEGALKDYTEGLRLKPDADYGFFNRGLVREKLADYKGAAADFQKYLDLGGGRRFGDQTKVEERIRKLAER